MFPFLVLCFGVFTILLNIPCTSQHVSSDGATDDATDRPTARPTKATQKLKAPSDRTIDGRHGANGAIDWRANVLLCFVLPCMDFAERRDRLTEGRGRSTKRQRE